MPIANIAVGVLELGTAIVVILLSLRVRQLRQTLESARHEAASEERIRELLGVKQLDGEEDHRGHGRVKRRHLRLLPVAGLLAGGLAMTLSWARHHPGPIAATAAAVAAALTALLVAVGSGSSETRQAEPTPPRPLIIGPPIISPSPDTTTPPRPSDRRPATPLATPRTPATTTPPPAPQAAPRIEHPVESPPTPAVTTPPAPTTTTIKPPALPDPPPPRPLLEVEVLGVLELRFGT